MSSCYTLVCNHGNTAQCVVSHELVVLADGFWYLGFGDPHGLDLEPRGHADEVLLQSRLQVLVNLVWRRGVWGCEGRSVGV